ncbi:MAG: hypothetical protein ACFFFH_11420 [Candidatus Thorarchaeota archaeon]
MKDDEVTLSVAVKTVVNTSLPMKDIEITTAKKYGYNTGIYLCEGNRSTGAIETLQNETTWIYESIFIDSIRVLKQLAIRISTNERIELILGHYQGLV